MNRLAFVLAVCVARTAMAEELPNEADLVGTYQVIICRGPCSFANASHAVAEGSLVLLANEMPPSETSKLAIGFQPNLSRGNANACYVLRRLPDRAYAGYANTRGAALTVWSRTNGELHVSLFRSPDAGYEVVLKGAAQALSGTGQSWGSGVAEPTDKTKDSVIARRTGAADIRACGFGAKRYLQVR